MQRDLLLKPGFAITLLFIFSVTLHSQPPKTFEDWYILGRDQVAAGKFQEAINSYSQSIKLKPAGSAAYIRRGEAYSFLNNDSMAIMDYNMAIKIAPKISEPYLLRGLVYLAKQKLELAKADFTKTIELEGSTGHPEEAYYYRGLVHSSQMNTEIAISDFTKSIAPDISPMNSSSLYERGKIYFSQKKYDLAILDFSSAIKVDSVYKKPNPINYFSRGVSYFNINKIEEAINDFTRAVQMDPADIRSVFYRSIAYCAAGKKDLAKTDESKVIQMGGKIEQPCQ